MIFQNISYYSFIICGGSAAILAIAYTLFMSYGFFRCRNFYEDRKNGHISEFINDHIDCVLLWLFRIFFWPLCVGGGVIGALAWLIAWAVDRSW